MPNNSRETLDTTDPPVLLTCFRQCEFTSTVLSMTYEFAKSAWHYGLCPPVHAWTAISFHSTSCTVGGTATPTL